jgi:acetyl esterase
MPYIPNPTTKDLSILDPEVRGVIQILPSTIENAETPQVAINFMRAAPPRPHQHPEVDKVDLLVSHDHAKPEQPPTSVRIYLPRKAIQEHGKLPVVLWSVSK